MYKKIGVLLLALVMVGLLSVSVFAICDGECEYENGYCQNCYRLEQDPNCEHDWRYDCYCYYCMKLEPAADCDHENATYIYDRLPTACQSRGLIAVNCPDCGFSENVAGPRVPHSWVDGKCAACGMYSVDYCAHVWGEWTYKDGKEPSCEYVTWRISECIYCGLDTEEIVGMLAHDWWVGYCQRCHMVYDGECGHENCGPWEIVKEADCANEGQRSRYCLTCGEVLRESIPKTDTHAWSDGSCSVCGISSDEVCAHTYGAWSVLQQPTCSVIGKRERICTKCGDSDIEAMPKIAHSWSYGTCDICAATSDGICEHEWGNWEIVEEATCFADGFKRVFCTICGYDDGEIIPKLPHSWNYGMCDVCGSPSYDLCEHEYGEWQVMEPPTCTLEGGKVRYCTICGLDGEGVVAIPKIDHTYSNGVCTVCGAEGTSDSVICDGECEYENGYCQNCYRLEQDPNCEHDWRYDYYCYYCMKLEPTADCDHENATYIYDRLPTACQSRGLIAVNCPDCGFSENVAGPRVPHSWVDGKCAACGMYSVDYCAHVWGEWTYKDGKAPSCKYDTEGTADCIYCGFDYTEVFKALPHSWQNGVCSVCGIAEVCEHEYGAWTQVKGATCTTEGSQKRVCIKCGHNDVKPIPKVPHTFVDGVCTSCGVGGAGDSINSGGSYAQGYTDAYNTLINGVIEEAPIQGFIQGMWYGVLSFVTILGNGISIGGISLFSVLVTVLILCAAYLLFKVIRK